MLYSDTYTEQAQITLRTCALVCSSWRVRSQRWIFYCVTFNDTAPLQRFVAVMEASPHLRDYVHQAVFRGPGLYTVASPLSLFPVILQGNLPKLQQITIRCDIAGEDSYLPSSTSVAARRLPHIVLHPRFTLYLSAFTSVTSLRLFDVTFQHYNDFARMVNSFPNLRMLHSTRVRWVTMGAVPLCMEPRVQWGRTPARAYAQNLKTLLVRLSVWSNESRLMLCFQLINMGPQGSQRLITACAPHLTELWVRAPLLIDPERSSPGMGSSFLPASLSIDPRSLADPAAPPLECIDLSLCSKLERLHILSNPELATHKGFQDMLKEMLKSWSPDIARQSIFLRPHVPCTFTRHKFGELLHKVGDIMEEWIHDRERSSSSRTNGKGSMHRMQPLMLRVDLWDWPELREGWIERVRECFPTLVRSKGLRTSCVRRKWSSARCREQAQGRLTLYVTIARNGWYQWKYDNVAQPLPDITSL